MLSSRLNRRISDNLHNLTPSEKLIGRHVSEDAGPIALLSAAAVADQIGVSEATLSRFARALSYRSYADLQRDVREEVQGLLGDRGASDGAAVDDGAAASAPYGVLEQTFRYDADNLKRTLSRISPESFDAAATAVARARRTYVLGFRGSAGVATYLGYLLNLVHPDVRTLARGSETAFDQMLSMTSEDVLITITLARASGPVADLMAYAKERSASIILITDVMSTSRADLADHLFVADSISTGFVQSYSAAMSLSSALAYAVPLIDERAAAGRLEQMERLFDQYAVVDPAVDKRFKTLAD